MPIETYAYDTAEHLKTEDDGAFYVEAALEDGDPALLREAIGIVARARGMAQVAMETGLSRESLDMAVAAEGKPAFDTISRVLKALGLQLTVKPITPTAP